MDGREDHLIEHLLWAGTSPIPIFKDDMGRLAFHWRGEEKQGSLGRREEKAEERFLQCIFPYFRGYFYGHKIHNT